MQHSSKQSIPAKPSSGANETEKDFGSKAKQHAAHGNSLLRYALQLVEVRPAPLASCSACDRPFTQARRLFNVAETLIAVSPLIAESVSTHASVAQTCSGWMSSRPKTDVKPLTDRSAVRLRQITAAKS